MEIVIMDLTLKIIIASGSSGQSTPKKGKPGDQV